MKLTINLKDENVKSIIDELYTKGCNEAAEAIEHAYLARWKNKEDKSEIDAFIRGFGAKAFCNRAYYNKNTKGELSAYYEIWTRDENRNLIITVHRKPFITSLGKIYGRPVPKKWLVEFYIEAMSRGAKEV